MHQLIEAMAERIAASLERKVLTTCSKWATKIRVMGRPYPGPWTFKHHPWLKDMHDSTCELNIGQKSAQMGYTETVLNIAFFHIDVKGIDCLYVLPAKTPDASDFSAARFDAALELSNHLSKLFSDVKNVGHKRAGAANLYIRGSRSRAGLKSIPVGLIILDEVDEMNEDNVPLAMERASGQVEKLVWALSTPTIPGSGINKLYRDSSQEQYFFRCPGCSKLTSLIFPDCIEITATDINDPRISETYLKCRECGKKLEHKEKTEWLSRGKWVPNYTDRASRGFHINQLYSCTVSPAELAKSYLRSLQDPTEEQEFYNSKLGIAHVVKNAGINDEDLIKCTKSYKMYPHFNKERVVTMGVDVGKWLHYEIDEWHIPGDIVSTDLNVQSKAKVLAAGKVLDFEELDNVVRNYNVMSAVIDANPERRKAYEFSTRFSGYVKMCFYGQGVQGKQIHIGKDDEPLITVDRTSWLDLSLGRFRNGTIEIPLDTPQEYKTHMKALVRVYEKDRNGNHIGRYVKGNDEDHYAHARNYAELALPFAIGGGESENIEGDY